MLPDGAWRACPPAVTATPRHSRCEAAQVVGEVGLEPTKAKPADLQSAPFATRDTLPVPEEPLATGHTNQPRRPEREAVYGDATGLCQQQLLRFPRASFEWRRLARDT